MTTIDFNLADLDEPTRSVTRRIGGDAPWDIFVLNGRATRFWTRSAGGFSMKWMAEGRACYRIDRRAHLVSREAALLVDQDQPYEMEFEARRRSQSFCLFYSPALAAEAWASVEAGFSPDPEPIGLRGFPNVVFSPSRRLADLLEGLSADGPDGAAETVESRLLLALGEAVETAHRHRRVAARLPGTRPATRARTLALLERARRHMTDRNGVAISLSEAASVAGLSKFHFLRLFKAAYGLSPLAFAEQLRMSAARQALASTRQSIGELAADLGYDSPSAFAKAFRRQSGLSPAAFLAAAN